MLVLITVGLQIQPSSLLTPLSRICNPTSPSISICNALINTIWVRKHIYALKMLILITVGLQIQPSSLLTPLSRICNPTAPRISICNALINTIWVRKHIYALKMLILITVGLQIQPSRERVHLFCQIHAPVLSNGCTCFPKYMHLFLYIFNL